MSTLRYAPGEYLAGSVIREFFEAVSDELVRRGYPAVTIVSGTRLYETQEAIFRSRYVPASQVGSRFVYDFQWWNGVLWARISSAGRVAPPSREAPHVANIAADVGAPYNVYGAARDAMLRVINDLGLSGRAVNNGTSFGEVWHWESRVGAGSIGRPTGAGGSAKPKEWDEMASEQQVEDAAYRGTRRALDERGSAATQAIQNIEFITSQVQGVVAYDRPTERQLATAIGRTTEILFAVDGRADPSVIDPATKSPVRRALAAFLQSSPDAPSSGLEVTVDEKAIISGVLTGLAENQAALVALIQGLPSETIAALKEAL